MQMFAVGPAAEQVIRGNGSQPLGDFMKRPHPKASRRSGSWAGRFSTQPTAKPPYGVLAPLAYLLSSLPRKRATARERPCNWRTELS